MKLFPYAERSYQLIWKVGQDQFFFLSSDSIVGTYERLKKVSDLTWVWLNIRILKFFSGVGMGVGVGVTFYTSIHPHPNPQDWGCHTLAVVNALIRKHVWIHLFTNSCPIALWEEKIACASMCPSKHCSNQRCRGLIFFEWLGQPSRADRFMTGFQPNSKFFFQPMGRRVGLSILNPTHWVTQWINPDNCDS